MQKKSGIFTHIQIHCGMLRSFGKKDCPIFNCENDTAQIHLHYWNTDAGHIQKKPRGSEWAWGSPSPVLLTAVNRTTHFDVARFRIVWAFKVRLLESCPQRTRSCNTKRHSIFTCPWRSTPERARQQSWQPKICLFFHVGFAQIVTVEKEKLDSRLWRSKNTIPKIKHLSATRKNCFLSTRTRNKQSWWCCFSFVVSWSCTLRRHKQGRTLRQQHPDCGGNHACEVVGAITRHSLLTCFQSKSLGHVILQELLVFPRTPEQTSNEVGLPWATEVANNSALFFFSIPKNKAVLLPRSLEARNEQANDNDNGVFWLDRHYPMKACSFFFCRKIWNFCPHTSRLWGRRLKFFCIIATQMQDTSKMARSP